MKRRITFTTNSYGIPVLRDMYLLAMEKCPHSNTYTYLNGDIISNYSFVETIEAISSTSGMAKDWLLVGQRMNVNWTIDFQQRTISVLIRTTVMVSSLILLAKITSRLLETQ